MTTRKLKKQKLRNNEYYNTQGIFDDLYNKAKTKNNYKFYKLMDLISSNENIELAYRNIKRNLGSTTSGPNKNTISDLAIKTNTDITKYIKSRLSNYHPHKVRREEILKDNGKIRPLGIPTIEDRIIQQCIKQILEPICEAKFFNHSYGFRPNRSTHDAMARAMFLANQTKLHYVVDIDIKGFFDNVNHGKLLKQMWTLGIQDKQLLCIISKMLKAPIDGFGIPSKGTPQGGILSPLLSNIVLNELDWWIADQWEVLETKHKYSSSGKYRALKNSNLKEIFMVRYADDFKIFCRNYKTASKIFYATRAWLKERLNLDISEEKSKIVNLKTNYSEFLGFKMKVHEKANKKVVKSHISDKSKKKIKEKLKQQILKIQKNNTSKSVSKYNSMVLGIHNYYRIATHVSIDLNYTSYVINKILYNRTRNIQNKNGIKSKCYMKFYANCNYRINYIQSIALFPIDGIKTTPPMSFSQDICNYTKEGREKIHKKQQSVSTYILKYIMENPVTSRSIEYNDNRISLYVGQNGICPVSKVYLDIGNMDCHHITPLSNGGTDEYKNLIILKTEVHKLVHATNSNTINKYLNLLQLDKFSLDKLNNLRISVGNSRI